VTEPREHTTDEVRKIFTDHVDTMIRYWATLRPDETLSGGSDIEWRLEGLTHSIFAALDGCSMACPGFIVAPMPHASDQAYHEENGENWFPYNDADAIKGDIAGSLRYWRSNRKDIP
jgi:hypothetical protein